MSWLTDFLTPNDARPRRPPPPQSSHSEPPKRILEEPSPSSTPPSQTPEATEPSKSSSTSLLPEPKPHRPKLLFSAGVVFTIASIIITRRALARKRLAAKPPYYTNSLGHTEEQSRKTSGAREAMEALNLATINVMSVAMMLVGGGLWYFDVDGLEGLRGRVRASITGGEKKGGEGGNEVEEQFEEYLAGILGGGKMQEDLVKGIGKDGKAEGAVDKGKDRRELAREEFEREKEKEKERRR